MHLRLALIACVTLLFARRSPGAVTIDFFDASQSYNFIQSGATSDTIESEGYYFTYTRDKFWSPVFGGTPTGRFVTVDWPTGLQAQAVTAGPQTGPAKFTISRVDGDVFDLTAFSAKLLANTAGAGGSIEVMPKLAGEDGFADPLAFFASGYAGNVFSYDTSSPSWMGNTSLLTGFDTYQMTLYVDFALMNLQLSGPLTVPEPSVTALFFLAALPLVARRRRAGYNGD